MRFLAAAMVTCAIADWLDEPAASPSVDDNSSGAGDEFGDKVAIDCRAC